MLKLERKPGQNICINDDIRIQIRKINGQQVSLAIAAPIEVPVRRVTLEPEPEPPLIKSNLSRSRWNRLRRRSKSRG